MKKILWLDTETTGLSPDKNGIIEIGIIIDFDYEAKHRIQHTMKPTGRYVDSEALKINGFTRDQIKDFIPWEELYKTFMDGLAEIAEGGTFVLAGQNVSFDNRFMKSWEKQCGSTTKHDWSAIVEQNGFIDTMDLFKRLQGQCRIPSHESKKLGNICKVLGIELGNAHSAMADIEATREAAYKMKKMLMEGRK